MSYVLPRPALAHCSSWSPVTPLTPTAPLTLPSTMIGTPPGEAKTPGRVAVAGAPLLITSMKTRVGRRKVAAAFDGDVHAGGLGVVHALGRDVAQARPPRTRPTA
jgi:hypothetical protein